MPKIFLEKWPAAGAEKFLSFKNGPPQAPKKFTLANWPAAGAEIFWSFKAHLQRALNILTSPAVNPY